MATLQSIRSKGSLLLAVIGLALLAFIVEEGVRAWQSSKAQSQQKIGEVYGNSIDVQDFQALVEEYTEIMKLTQGQSSLNEQQMNYLRDQVWNTYVHNQLIAHEAEKLGLTVTDKELRDVINAGTNPLLLQTPFVNQQTHTFDVNQLTMFLTNYENMKKQGQNNEQMDMYYNYWKFIEKNLKNNLLESKYQALLAKTFIANKVSAKMAFEDRTNESNLLLVALPYTSDRTTEVSDEEISKKYEELKGMFEQNDESRSVKFIDVRVTPSVADKSELTKEMNGYYQQLVKGEDAHEVVRDSKSQVIYSKVPVSKHVLPRDIQELVDSLAEGAVKAPFTSGDNTMNVVKLVSKVTLADSIEYQIIGLPKGADEAKAAKQADSIYNAIQGGAAFEEVAKLYNQPGTKSWIHGEAFEGANLGEDDATLIKGLEAAAAGSLNKFETSQAILIAKVGEKKAPTTKYDVAIIKRNIDFSKETYAKAYNDFSAFVATNQTSEDLIANATAKGYRVQENNTVTTADHYVGNVSDTRDAIKWIFNEDTKVGDISPLYECGENDHLMVVVLTDINKGKYISLSNPQVKEYVKGEALKDKKAVTLLEQIGKTKSIAEAKALKGAVSDTVSNVTFAAPAAIMVTQSSEPAISGKASVAKQGAFVTGIKGHGGVYAFQVLSKQTTKGAKYNEKEEMAQLAGTYMQGAYRFANELFKNAKVKDHRYLFF
jgi:peptidyl-prolyl cis-trans isomerase D